MHKSIAKDALNPRHNSVRGIVTWKEAKWEIESIKTGENGEYSSVTFLK